jgi:hypothetical protein
LNQLSALDLARLRATLATLDREISRLPPASPPNELLSSWRALVAQLDLGSAPELRQCPICNRPCMHNATVCGYCWTRLAPLAPV